MEKCKLRLSAVSGYVCQYIPKEKCKSKKTIVLFFCVLLNITVRAQGRSKIFLNLENADVATVLQEVKKQATVRFVYDPLLLSQGHRISIHANGEDLPNILGKVCKNQPFSFSIKGNMVLFVPANKNVAAETNVDIKVISKNNQEAIAGASVFFSDGYMTTSDLAGKFQIPTQRMGLKIKVSAVGYEDFIFSQEATPQSKHYTIALKPIVDSLDEVSIFSNGYQTIPKERATGSFSLIDNQLFNEQITPNILERLEAVGNSISVTAKNGSNTGQMHIRGLSTIRGPQDPLIIVDNFPYNGDIANLNPNDVESISILKDAAAASIWGAKAGNGVIVITTKKGRFNQQAVVEINANIQITARPDLYYLPTIRSADYVELEKFLFGQQYRFADTSSWQHVPFSPVYEALFQERNGLLSSSETEAILSEYSHHDVRDDLLKYVYSNAVHQQYSLNVRGGNDRQKYALAGSFDQDYSAVKARNSRAAIKFANTFKLAPSIELEGSIAYTAVSGKNGKTSYFNTINGSIPPYTMLADREGNALPLYTTYRKGYIDTLGQGLLQDWRYFPLRDDSYIHANNHTTDILLNLGVKYKIVEGLELYGIYQFERQLSLSEMLYDKESYYARDMVNSFSMLDYATNSIRYNVPSGGIKDNSQSEMSSKQGRLQMSFHKKIEKVEYNLLAGGELREAHTLSNSNRLYGYDPELLNFGNVDYTTAFPHLVTQTENYIPSGEGVGDITNRFVSFFGNGSATLHNKYTLSASIRRDASNVFGVATNNKWRPLWSSGVKWDVSREKFYHSALFPTLKVRATYGFSGNVDPSVSGVTTITYSATSPYTNTTYARINNINNPLLRWEKVGMLNAGIDFTIFTDRVAGSVDYYHKSAKDLYGDVPIDYTAGLNKYTVLKNVASMSADGIDLQLNTTNIQTKFTWLTQINTSYNLDKIVDYYLSTDMGSFFVSRAGTISGVKGKSVYGLLAYKWQGLDPSTGNPQGYLNGSTSQDYAAITGTGTSLKDLVYIGPSNPKVFGNIGNTFSYCGFSVSIRMMYKFGHYFMRKSINYADLVNSGNGHSDYSSRWRQPGDERHTTIPSFVYPINNARDNFYTGAEILAEKADNIRLQYITVSYALSKVNVKQLPVQSIRWYVNCNNLGILWKANHKGIDPDYSTGVIPAGFNAAIGINIQF